MEYITIKELVGKTMASVEQIGDTELVFRTTDGTKYTFYHRQDCCESVTIESVVGDLSDLVGTPIVVAEERTSKENPEGVTLDYQYSFTWTFYCFRTIKGSVDVRWYGESNGYYSESIDLRKEG